MDVIEKRWAEHGFTINRTKTHVWVPSGNDLTLDPGVQVKELPILGAKLKVQGDQEDAPVTLGAKPGEDLGKATARLKTLFNNLHEITEKGLERHISAALFRLYVGNGSAYPLRLGDATEESAKTHDELVRECWGWLAGRKLSDEAWTRASLPLSMGGCGVPSAESRRAPAAWAAWTSAIPIISKALALDDPTSVILQSGPLLEPLQKAHSALSQQAPDLASARMEFHGAIKMPVKQKTLTNAINEGTRARVLEKLETSEKAMFRSFGGQGAGTWLEGPPDVSCILPNPLWQTSVRLRMGMPAAAADDATRTQGACRNTTAAGRVCGEPLSGDDMHPLHCACGGGVVLRHASLARSVGRMAAEHRGTVVRYEQRTPALDKIITLQPSGETKTLEAILDVVYDNMPGQVLLDVRVCSPCAGEHAWVQAAARRDGEAAARQVRNKETRYGPTVTPFVVETGGRPSKEAREWVRTLARDSQHDEPPSMLGAGIWAHISCTLQRYIAVQLRKAEGRL